MPAIAGAGMIPHALPIRLALIGGSLALASCGYVRPALVHALRLGPPASVGVNSDITWGIPRPDVREEVSLMRGASVQWIRASIDLSAAQPTRHGSLSQPYMRQLDFAVRSARAAGISVLLDLDRAPYWASADPHKFTDGTGLHWNDYWMYKNWRDYGRIVAKLVKHFKRLGVHAFELWSEPNWLPFWPSGPDARAYVKLLQAAYPAVKRADPKATVVIGGLSDIRGYAYLNALYRAGARRYYDVMNFHDYPAGNPEHCARSAGGIPSEHSFCALDVWRKEMLAHGDRKPAWLTEIGWSTCRNHPPCVSLQTQASYTRKAWSLLADRSYSWLHRAFVYTFHDLLSASSNVSWGSSLGIVARDFTPKPVYYVVKALAQHARALDRSLTQSNSHRKG